MYNNGGLVGLANLGNTYVLFLLRELSRSIHPSYTGLYAYARVFHTLEVFI